MGSSNLNIVFVVSRFPYPLTKGDRLRAYYQIKELSKNHKIHLIALSDSSVTMEAQNELAPYCESIHIYRLSKISIAFRVIWALLFKNIPLQVAYFSSNSIKRQIHHRISEISPDILYSQLVRTSEYIKEIQNVPKYLDFMDAMSAGMQRRIKKSAFYFRWIWKKETLRLKKYEHQIVEYFDGASIISAADQKRIVNYHNELITVVPNGVDLSYFNHLETRKSGTLLFTGNMSYPPNVESALFLANEIFPLIHQQNPQAKLIIAGANPVRKIKDLASEHIQVTGWVKDIRPYYDTASIFIAPMLIGSGLQNKLLEAMACGIPCITSTLANNSLGAKENDEILIGINARDYADQAMKLLNSNNLANQIGKNGYTFVQNNFNWTASVSILEKNFEEVIKIQKQ